MPAIGFELFVILLLILTNGVFAMAETALVSARKARLQEWADAGNPRARAALQLAQHLGEFLSTVQIGITLVGILAGAFGGVRLAAPLADALRPLPGIGPYSETLGLGLVVGAIAYLSLVVGELVPKQLALTSPERIATALAGPMRLVARLVSPAVRLLSRSTAAVLGLLCVRPVPVSPKMSTVASVSATFSTCASTRRIAAEEPTISSNIDARSISSRNARFSWRIRSSACLRSSMSMPVAYQRRRHPWSSHSGL
jgi:CBS domain containing-hemolysin-like protein